jgi:DNA-binding CsgD family transcriptional regulator
MQIGRVLGLAARTVEFHRGRIMAKTGIKSATGLVRHACVPRRS